MLVVTAIQSKGGVGKTTALMGLACAAAARGQRVVLIDTDQNKPLGRWEEAGRETGHWSDLVATRTHLSFDELQESVTRLEDEGAADLVLIDTKGGRSNFLTALAQFVDLIIVPSRPVKVDADEVMTTFRWFKEIERAGADVAPAVLLFSVMKPPSQRSVDMLAMRAALARAPHFDAEIRELASIVNMQSRGLLGEIIARLRADANALARGRAGAYQGALDIMSGLYDEVIARAATRAAQTA